jgi:hypothetical protein
MERFRATFGYPVGPLDIDALASFLGIGRSVARPAHSEDAELVPVGNGRVAIRVNPDRPETRRRFSIAHEVVHTFFPNYQTKTWCRTDSRFRSRDNPDDLVEMLCDAGAAELILPAPWFIEDARVVRTAAGLLELARKYVASREATLGNKDQTNLFGADPAEIALSAKKLRLDYSIPSPNFIQAGHYLPADKSVPNDGPLYTAASTGQPCEDKAWLDVGPSAGLYRVLAIPVWADDHELGPNGENAVGAIIEPIDIKPSKRRSVPSVRGLFDQ